MTGKKFPQDLETTKMGIQNVSQEGGLAQTHHVVFTKEGDVTVTSFCRSSATQTQVNLQSYRDIDFFLN